MIGPPSVDRLSMPMVSRTASKQSVTVDGPAGRIEALLEMPRLPEPRAVAVLCHPHPQFQGTMLNKVVHTLARAALELEAAALRFNFRGVGASDGEYGGGSGEVGDALAVVDFARARFAGAPLWLCGFSFGAMVASAAALEARPARLVIVAPPAGRMAGLLGGEQPRCPWLIVQGDADEVVPAGEVIDWVDGLEPGPELVVLPGVEHFFHGRLTLLRETVTDWLRGGGAP